jgi:hypothetical protein
MSLEEKVVFVNGGNTPIDNCSRFGIPVVISMGSLCGIKSRVVSLSTDDNSQFGAILALGGVKLPERCSDFGDFILNDSGELALKGVHVRRSG